MVKPIKDKTVLNAFIEIVNESNHKPNKLWVDQGREFHNNFTLHHVIILIKSVLNKDKYQYYYKLFLENRSY